MLNNFFNSPKQNEKLEEAQRQLLLRYEDIEVNQNVQDSSASTDQDLSNLNSEIDEATTYTPLKILRTINECNTRWGSSLASWKRLKELKGPIQHVIFKLSLETSKEAKKDYEILKKRFLKYWEWDLLDHLIDLFKPIEEATEWLGGQKYCTLSLIYPTIQALKYDYVVTDAEGIFLFFIITLFKLVIYVLNFIYCTLYTIYHCFRISAISEFCESYESCILPLLNNGKCRIYRIRLLH